MSAPAEKTPANIIMICKCGNDVEAEGHIDFAIHTCSECHKIGCWVAESELWEIPLNEPEEV
jgi:hypothetical protein